MLLFLAAACLVGWFAWDIRDDREAGMFVPGAVGLGCVAVVMWRIRRAGEEGFRWHFVDGQFFGEWKPGVRTASLPLSGPLNIDLRVRFPGDEELETVEAVACHESERFGRVELLCEMVGAKPSRHQVWSELDLRAAPLAAARGERLVLPCGWTGKDRLTSALFLTGLLLPFAGLMLGKPALPVYLSLCLLVGAWLLVRSMASIEMCRVPDGIQWRRVWRGKALGRWKRLLPPAVLDLTSYPRIEWRTEEGRRFLRVIGGPKGLQPDDALRVTEWMRQHEPLRRSLSA